MAGRRPPKGENSRTWSYQKLAEGEFLKGWKAGPMVCIETHYSGSSFPCSRALSGNKMSCLCQSRKLKIEWQGFVPLWRDDSKPVFVIVRDYVFPEVDTLQTFSPVVFGRPKSRFDSVWVRAMKGEQTYNIARNRQAKEEDISCFLFTTLFRRPDLLPYYLADEQNVPSNAGVTVDISETEEPASDPERERLVKLVQDNTESNNRRASETSRLADALGGVFVPPVSTNGTQKPKPR
jgi:hypothetical protein